MRRIHIGNRAIRRRAHNHEVDEGYQRDDFDAAAEIYIPQIDLRIRVRDLSGRQQFPPTQTDADGNQNESENKESRQEQLKNQTEVGIGGSAMTEDRDDPEANQNKGGSAGQASAQQTQWIVAVEQDRAKGLFD